MKARRILSLSVGVAIAVSLPATRRVTAEPAADAAREGRAAEDARRAKVVARVGERTITVGELEDRLAVVPPFQLQTFGATREEATRKFLEDVVIHEQLLVAGARARKLDAALPWQHQVARARSNATLRASRAALPNANALSSEDVQRYYEANRARYDAPERVNLWRILCKTKEEAASVLETAKRDQTIAKWNELAREHSIDKATYLRGGNLGFVADDGKSNEAGLVVERALVAAARQVKDGELVQAPVAEGKGFAVVWRRMTTPANKQSLEDASAQIRATLYRERVETAERALLEELRKQHLREVHPDLLKIVELGAMDAGLTIPRAVPKPTAAAE